jgi:hypothetical protein
MTVDAVHQSLRLHAFARADRRDNCRTAAVATVPKIG